MNPINPQTYQPVHTEHVRKLVKSLPSLSTITIVALKAIALVGIAIFSICFPLTSIFISISGFVIYRVLMETTQLKFDKCFNEQTNLNENYSNVHRQMLKSVKVMQAIANNRHLVQVASLGAIIAFWHVKVPLIILGVGIGAIALAVDFFDSRECIRRLKDQVYSKIYNPAYNPNEEAIIRKLYPNDDEGMLSQKFEIERNCRISNITFVNSQEKCIANAWAYMLNSGQFNIEQGEESDPEIFIPLGQLSWVYLCENQNDQTLFKRSPILRVTIEKINLIKEQYDLLSLVQKSDLKRKIVFADKEMDEAVENCFNIITQLHTINAWIPPVGAIAKGTEMHLLKKFKIGSYLIRKVEYLNELLFNPGKLRTA